MFLFYIALGLIVGGVAGYAIRQSLAGKKIGSAESRAEKILEEAKSKERELLLEAKSKALEITEQAKKAESDFRAQIVRFEERIDRREKELNSKEQDLDAGKKQLEARQQETQKTLEEAKEVKAKQLATLEKIAGLTREDAGKILMENAERTISEEMVKLHRKLVANAHETAEKEARRIVAQAIDRVVSEVTAETTTTTVALPSEELKGRIIGKEGRNIRAFEQMMGVEILIDDSPDTVVISGFNSIRRHIGKLTLEKLVSDGRIHPARIEEAYEKSKAEINEQRAGTFARLNK
jgi:ribonuclease Y